MDRIIEFLERTERLCKVLAHSIETPATNGSAKETLLQMGDEAIDLAAELKHRPSLVEDEILRAIR